MDSKDIDGLLSTKLKKEMRAALREWIEEYAAEELRVEAAKQAKKWVFENKEDINKEILNLIEGEVQKQIRRLKVSVDVRRY